MSDEEEPTDYDVGQNAVTMNQRATVSWELAVHQLLTEADQGLFSGRLKLETRTGRILYSTTRNRQDEEEDDELRDARKNNTARASILDVPVFAVSTPPKLTIFSRALRVHLSAYLAQWLYQEVMLTLQLRAALDSSVNENRLVKGLFNTAMGVHVSWPDWKEDSFKRAKVNISASMVLTYAVEALYYLFVRDIALDQNLRVTQKFMQDGTALKDAVQSLIVLLILSSPPESKLNAAESVSWMFKNEEEKSILQNAVGACLEAWFRADPSGKVIKELVSSQYFPNAVQLLLSYVKPRIHESKLKSFAPSLPFPSKEHFNEYWYPWPACIIHYFGNSFDFQSWIASNNIDLSTQNDFKAATAHNRQEWPVIQEKIKSTFAGKLEERLKDKSVAGTSTIQTTSNDNNSILSTHTRRSARIGEKRTRAAIATTTTTSSPNPYSRKRTRENDSIEEILSDEEDEDEELEQQSELSSLNGKKPEMIQDPNKPALISSNDWNHVNASKALINLLWSEGVPWHGNPIFSMSPKELSPIESFSKGGDPAPEGIVNTLIKLHTAPPRNSSTGIRTFNDSEPVFLTPNPSLICFAAVASSRASILAQAKRFKTELVANVNEVVRSAAFTMVAATRVQSVEAINRHDKVGLILSTSSPILNAPVIPLPPSEKSIISFCTRAGFPKDSAYVHIAIAREIAKGTWTPNFSVFSLES